MPYSLLLKLVFILLLTSCIDGIRLNRFDGYQPHHKPLQGRPHHSVDDRIPGSKFTCRSIQMMLRKKTDLIKLISQRMNDVIIAGVKTQKEEEPLLISKESELKLHVLKLYQQELNASENALLTVITGFNRTLSSDYHSLDKIESSCEARMSEIQKVAVRVEENHNGLLKLMNEAKHLSTSNSSHIQHLKLLNEILSEISQAADKLEINLKKDLFNDIVDGKVPGTAAEIETVVKIGGGAGVRDYNSIEGDNENQVILVDSFSNQYTLSRPNDITVSVSDPFLVKDFISLLVMCSLLGAFCSLIGIPPLFGYGVAGMLLGPAGSNIIKSVVQVETIGEFGAVFIVFMAGLKLTFDKLWKHYRSSLQGSVILLISCIVMTCIIGAPLGMMIKHCFFVAATLSLASASLMQQFIEALDSTNRKRTHSNIDLESSILQPPVVIREERDSNLVGSLRGILVIQDIQMALLIALLPVLEDSDSQTSSIASYLYSIWKLIFILFAFFVLLLLTVLLSRYALKPAFHILLKVKNKGESLLLGSLAICSLLLGSSIFLGQSLEIACFLAGVAISAQGNEITTQVRNLMDPIKEIFAIFFFASIGFHVFPTFLISEFLTIFSVTFCVVVFKLTVVLLIIGYQTTYCNSTTWSAAISMAQVSEFSFILSSRARRFNIISRETYLVLLSVTALSLILAPFLWQIPHLISLPNIPNIPKTPISTPQSNRFYKFLENLCNLIVRCLVRIK